MEARSRERGIAWGTQVAQEVLAWRAADGFTGSYPAFTGGTAVGQWRPTPPAFGPMSAQGLAFTFPFVLVSSTQFAPPPPRDLSDTTYADGLQRREGSRRQTGSTRTDDQTALAPFWEGNASVHWNQAANQIARANRLSMSTSNRLLAVLNIAMADTAITTWSAKRFYGAVATEVTWRPVTAIPLADTDGNPDTAADPAWLPLVNTPSHPEYPGRASEPERCGRDRFAQSLRRQTSLHVDDTDSRAGPITASRGPAETETTPASGVACTTRARSPSATQKVK